MNVSGTAGGLTVEDGKRSGGGLYRLCFAAIVGLLLTLGLAVQAQGAPPSADCINDSVPYRINAGGPELAGPPLFCRDTQFKPSQYVNVAEAGNKTFITEQPIDMSHPSIPAGTPQELFQRERWDPELNKAGEPTEEMSWAFLVEPGNYEVRLYFAEVWPNAQAPDKREFDVLIEGALKLDNYDVFAEAGGGYKGIIESFTVASDSTLNIDFKHEIQNPAVKAIEILPATEPPPPEDTTEPRIARPKPEPRSEIRDRTPIVRAIVRDETSELARRDIKLYLDGEAKRFSYDRGTDRLSSQTRRLSYGWHKAKVVATDGAGNRAAKSWGFKVIRPQ